jgi:hypothetical protein
MPNAMKREGDQDGGSHLKAGRCLAAIVVTSRQEQALLGLPVPRPWLRYRGPGGAAGRPLLRRVPRRSLQQAVVQQGRRRPVAAGAATGMGATGTAMEPGCDPWRVGAGAPCGGERG